MRAQDPSKIMKNNSQGIISVTISCQRVLEKCLKTPWFLKSGYFQPRVCKPWFPNRGSRFPTRQRLDWGQKGVKKRLIKGGKTEVKRGVKSRLKGGGGNDLRAKLEPPFGNHHWHTLGSQARKRHININFLVRLLLGHPGNVPGTKWVCPGDKPRFSPYFTQWKPSLSLGQTRFVPGTNRGRRAAERVYVLQVYVPFPFPRFRHFSFRFCAKRVPAH